MDLADLKTELKSILRDPTAEASFTFWLNESVKQIAAQFDLPALRLKSPTSLTVTTTNWQYLASAGTPTVSGHTYMKNMFLVTNSTHERGLPIARDLHALTDRDSDHSDTGTSVSRVAVEDETDDAIIGIYPKANDTLFLWYYRNPLDMSSDHDVPDGIPAAYHYSVLIPKCVLFAFRLYPQISSDERGDNSRALQLWTNNLRKGLYGDGYEIGMLDFLAKSNRKPRLRGAPPGSNLAGADAVSRWR